MFGKDNVKSATDCKEKLKTDAMGHFETQANQKFINDMTEHLIDNTKFSLPDAFLKKWMQTAGENPITAEEAEALRAAANGASVPSQVVDNTASLLEGVQQRLQFQKSEEASQLFQVGALA